MLNRRLASLLVTAATAGLLATGCGSNQAAAVRVDDRTVSRSDFEESLDVFYENDELRGLLFEVSRDQLRPADGPSDAYTQEYVGAIAGVHVQFMVLAEALDAEGIELTDEDRQAVSQQIDGAVAGGTDSLPDGVRDRLVDGFAALDRLRADLGDSEFNAVANEVIEGADISVSSRYGSWNDDEFAVTPPSGSAPAPGSEASAPELDPG